MKQIQLTKDQITQIVAAVFFGGIFLFGYLNYFWLPLGKKIKEGKSQIESIESDIAKAKSQKAKYKNLEAKLAELQLQKEAAQKKLPRERKYPDLIRTVDSLAKKYKVRVNTLTPSGSAQVEYFVKVSYSMSVTGSYHDLARFLTALGTEERILASENLNITAAASDENSLTATFVLVAYQYNG